MIFQLIRFEQLKLKKIADDIMKEKKEEAASRFIYHLFITVLLLLCY